VPAILNLVSYLLSPSSYFPAYYMKRNLLTTFLFTSVLFFGFASNVHAGSIIQAPTYLGLSSGLVGSW